MIMWGGGLVMTTLLSLVGLRVSDLFKKREFKVVEKE